MVACNYMKWLCAFLLFVNYPNLAETQTDDERISELDKFEMVSDIKQLWRFAVSDDGDYVSPGYDYICLIDYQGRSVTLDASLSGSSEAGVKYIRLRGGGCDRNAHWMPIAQEDNTWELLHTSNCYLTYGYTRGKEAVCAVGKAKNFRTLRLWINPKGDQLYIQHQRSRFFLGFYRIGGDIDTMKFVLGAEDATLFFGVWMGPKTGWKSTDGLELISDCDNRDNKVSATECGYVTQIGVKKTTAFKTRVYTRWKVTAGTSFAFFFWKTVVSRVDFDWATSGHVNFQKATDLVGRVEAPPGAYIRLYQVVGRYGIFEVRTTAFRSVAVAGKAAVAGRKSISPSPAGSTSVSISPAKARSVNTSVLFTIRSEHDDVIRSEHDDTGSITDSVGPIEAT